ncbi:MAG: hypothetical protein JWN71_1386 [Xanthobacteraceae bacterium]|jgi:hypothetical protein|nr:hypothetical protein [Xanthobacteraceae bacterium]
MRGKIVPLSIPRRMVGDLLHFAAKVPSIPVQRRISIGPILKARAACENRPRWTAIFTKAYAVVAGEFPELRRAYVKLPWASLYEYPTSSASVAIERDYQGEASLFVKLIKDPARLSLWEIGQEIKTASTAPADTIKEFSRAIRIAKMPRFIRRLLWWLGLNIGRQRGNYFGTFGLSVYSALNAESLHPLSPLTTLLNYGVIEPDGSVLVRVIYDHRVLDGATVARSLARLEEVLNSVITDELLGQHREPSSVVSATRPASS